MSSRTPARAPNGQFTAKPLTWWQKLAAKLLAKVGR